MNLLSTFIWINYDIKSIMLAVPPIKKFWVILLRTSTGLILPTKSLWKLKKPVISHEQRQLLTSLFIIFFSSFFNKNFSAKYTISTPLRIENPVNNPKVPPKRAIWVSGVFFNIFVHFIKCIGVNTNMNNAKLIFHCVIKFIKILA